MKHIIAMLQVCKEDFILNQNEPLATQQRAIGARLLANLQPQQQEQQQQEQQEGMQQEQQGAPECGEAQRQQRQQQPGAAAPWPSPGALPDAPGLRTASPKIAAFRSEQQYGGVVPTSPYDFPADSQTAAAALVLKQGDAASALLTLLDKAMEDRPERQSQRAALVQSLAGRPAPA